MSDQIRVRVSRPTAPSLEPLSQYVRPETLADENAALRVFPAPRVLPRGLNLLGPSFAGLTVSKTADCTIVTSQQETYRGEPCWRVTATAVGASQNFEINFPTHAGFSATDLLLEVAVTDLSGITLMYPYIGTSGYARSISATIGSPGPATVTMSPKMPTLTAFHFAKSIWSKNGFSTEIGDEVWTNAKIRFGLATNATATVYLRSAVVSARAASRIAIISDDGYSSWIERGVPILAEHGFISTCAVISSIVGNSGYATLAQLQRYVAAGNECVAHGPAASNGSGNLFTSLATDELRLADINATRDYLVANGLTSPAGAKCYVWPQGQIAESTSDFAFLDDVLAAGYQLGRGVTENFMPGHQVGAISATNPYRLVLTCVGHTWTSGGAEAANVAAIITKIQNASADGMDCVLKLHKVVGVDAAAASLEISSNRLREICAAIKTLVNAGIMSVVRFSDLMI